jgi:hypothetical protein
MAYRNAHCSSHQLEGPIVVSVAEAPVVDGSMEVAVGEVVPALVVPSDAVLWVVVPTV